MELIVFFVILIISLMSVYTIEKINKKRGIIGKNYVKKDDPPITEAGGIALTIPITILFIAYLIFIEPRIEVAVLGVILIIFSLIGYLDDTKSKFIQGSYGWEVRTIPTIILGLCFAALVSPNLLWIIPFTLFLGGMAGLENTFAGLNGWEVGSGSIALIFVTIILQNTIFYPLAIGITAAAIGLLLFNKYPAKILPGDSGTLIIGASIGGLLLLTKNPTIMLLGLLFFLPNIIDLFLLKIITNLRDMSQSRQRPYKILDDGRLGIPEYKDGKTKYDFAKMIIKIFGPLKEWQIVIIIWIIVITNNIIWTILYFNGLLPIL